MGSESPGGGWPRIIRPVKLGWLSSGPGSGPVCPHTFTKFVIPVTLVSGDEFLHMLPDCFVEGLCEAIGKWIVCFLGNSFTMKFVAELLDDLSDELMAIVLDDALQDAEAVNDALLTTSWALISQRRMTSAHLEK